MQSADLTERITFTRKTEQTRPNGEVIYAAEDFASMWAAVTPLSSKESYDAGGDFVYKKYSFKIRYRADLTEEMNIQYEGRTYDVSVINRMFSEDRNRFSYIEAIYREKS